MTTWEGDEYQARFDALAASGVEVHGEADFVEAYAPASVLDAGCGTGRVGIELARRGIEVVGVDVDASMLATARRTAPELTWVQSDLTVLDLGRTFTLVLLAGNVPLFTPPGTQPALVARGAAHVAPNGHLVAGFSLNRGYGLDRLGPRLRRRGAGPRRPLRHLVPGPVRGRRLRRLRPRAGLSPASSPVPARSSPPTPWATPRAAESSVPTSSPTWSRPLPLHRLSRRASAGSAEEDVAVMGGELDVPGVGLRDQVDLPAVLHVQVHRGALDRGGGPDGTVAVHGFRGQGTRPFQRRLPSNRRGPAASPPGPAVDRSGARRGWAPIRSPSWPPLRGLSPILLHRTGWAADEADQPSGRRTWPGRAPSPTRSPSRTMGVPLTMVACRPSGLDT